MQEEVTGFKIDEMVDRCGSRFTLAILAAKRARQINNFLNNIKTAEPTDFHGPALDMVQEKPLTVAFREIAEGKIDLDGAPEN